MGARAGGVMEDPAGRGCGSAEAGGDTGPWCGSTIWWVSACSPDKACCGVGGGSVGSQPMAQESPPCPEPLGEGEGGKGKLLQGFSRVAAHGMEGDGAGQQPGTWPEPLGSSSHSPQVALEVTDRD